tara:strand:- start:633 stop:2582 length:1950 start_codon:yes stop_codon:yes gene_type:complete
VCFAQENTTDMSKSRLKRMAFQAENNNDYQTAIIFLEAYLERSPNDFSVIYQLAENYNKLGASERALVNYRLVKESKKAKKYPLVDFQIAEMLATTGDCKAAIPMYEQFRKDYRGQKDDRTYIRLSKFAIEGCRKLLDDTTSKRKYAIKALNEDINSKHIEGSPIHLQDNRWVYNSLKSDQTVFSISEEVPKRAFYVLDKGAEDFENKGLWDVFKNFQRGELANGAFNKDKSSFYFSACTPNPFGKIACDIYKIEKKDGTWSIPEKLPESVNTSRYTETQVAVGVDEKGRETIYFVSDRKEGKGGLDIWYSTYYKGNYKPARNCGSRVNSVGNEMTPSIHPLTNKLYFSSDGHPGFGKLDVFFTSGERSRWQEPENLGSWINSPADELYYNAHPNGEEGMFASNRLRSKEKVFCCDDLYYFKELNKIKVGAKGKVLADGKPLEDAQVKIFQTSDENDEKIFLQSVKSDRNGEYKVVLEPNQSYFIQSSKDGYLVDEKTLSTSNVLNSKEYELDFNLLEKKNRTFELKNIYYDYDATAFDRKSELAIDTTILEVLLLNPEVIVEIGSHTDNKGSAAYNQSLSQKRAESVVNYLRKKGISKDRMKAKGYGESQPAFSNTNPDGSDNPENRAKNRRTEFKVIGELELDDDDD